MSGRGYGGRGLGRSSAIYQDEYEEEIIYDDDEDAIDYDYAEPVYRQPRGRNRHRQRGRAANDDSDTENEQDKTVSTDQLTRLSLEQGLVVCFVQFVAFHCFHCLSLFRTIVLFSFPCLVGFRFFFVVLFSARSRFRV